MKTFSPEHVLRLLNSRMKRAVVRLDRGVPFEKVLSDELGCSRGDISIFDLKSNRSRAQDSMRQVSNEVNDEKQKALESFDSFSEREQVILILEALDSIIDKKRLGSFLNRLSDEDQALLMDLHSYSVRYQSKRYFDEELLQKFRIGEGHLPSIYAEIKAYQLIASRALNYLRGDRMNPDEEKWILAEAIFENLRFKKRLPPEFCNMHVHEREAFISYGVDAGLLDTEDGANREVSFEDYFDSIADGLTLLAVAAFVMLIIENKILEAILLVLASFGVFKVLRELVCFYNNKYPLGFRESRFFRRLCRCFCRFFK